MLANHELIRHIIIIIIIINDIEETEFKPAAVIDGSLKPNYCGND